MTKRLEVGDVSYQFQIWDTAGQEKVGIAYTAESQQNARMDYCKSGYSCWWSRYMFITVKQYMWILNMQMHDLPHFIFYFFYHMCRYILRFYVRFYVTSVNFPYP